MEYSENSCKSYCPWLDESPTSLRINDSQPQPQQRVIPKKVKKLIDGDLAATSGKRRSTKDRLKDKLRRKQESRDQKELQESQNKDVTVFTDVEQISSKRKKRRKKSKKAPVLDKQEHGDNHEGSKLLESNEKVEVEEIAMKLNEVGSDPVDDGLHGDTLTPEAVKETALQTLSQKFTVTGHFGKRTTSEHYSTIVENLNKKLRRNLVVESCTSERKKLIGKMQREIEMEKRKQALKKDAKFHISRILFTAALQRLEAKRATLLRHKAVSPCPNIATTIGQKSSASCYLKSKVLSKPTVTVYAFEGKLNNAVEIPAEYHMKADLSGLDPMSIKDVVLYSPPREERQKHLIATCGKMYAFLRSFVPQALIELNIKPSSPVKNISVFGMNNSQFRSMSPVTYNCIQHAQTMSNALQVQEKKSLLLCISLGRSESKYHFTTTMLKCDNIRAIESFLIEAMKVMMNKTSATGLELVQRSDVPNSACMVQIGHGQLITICCDINLDFFEFLNKMKTYGLTSSLMKQTSTTGLELVQRPDVPNNVSMVPMRHGQLRTICGDLKLDLLEFLDGIKTYGLTSSLMKQTTTTGLELVKWSDVPNNVSMVQMGRSQLITFCGDLKLDALEFLDTMKKYGLTSSLMNEVVPAQTFSPASIEESVLTKSPPITGVTENRRSLLCAFKKCWMADTVDHWRSKCGIESTIPRKENAFEVANQWVKTKTKNIIDRNSVLDKRKLINLPSVVRMVDLASRKATIAFKNDSGKTQISVDFAELLKYANKIMEQHGLVTKISPIFFSKSQQVIKIEIQKANQVTDKLFIPVSNEASVNNVTQVGTFGKTIVRGLVKGDISKINRQGFRKDIELDIRKVKGYEKPAPEGGNLLHHRSATFGKTKEVSYYTGIEKLTPQQKEQRLQNMCDNDKIEVIETHVALKRQYVAELIKKITATEATRKYIFRLHKQMLKNISSEQEVKQQPKLNTIILSRHNVPPRNARKYELLKQKLQKDNTPETMRETNNRTVETVSTNHENTTRSQTIDEVPRQKDEQSENINIIDNLEQTHYGIRLCMFG